MTKPSYRHISGPGTQKSGQWVPCKAKIRCRNGGSHVTEETLQKARDKYLEVTGKNITILGQVPEKVIKDMLGKDAILPNNLSLHNGNQQTISKVRLVKEKDQELKPKKTKKVVKHFNAESNLLEILQTALNYNEYEIYYPIPRIVKFDKRTVEGRKNFQEASAFASTQRYARLPGGASARFFPQVNDKEQAIRLNIENKTSLLKWATIEAHWVISWSSIDAKEQDSKLRNKLNKNYEPEEEKWLVRKAEYIKTLHQLGIEDIID